MTKQAKQTKKDRIIELAIAYMQKHGSINTGMHGTLERIAEEAGMTITHAMGHMWSTQSEQSARSRVIKIMATCPVFDWDWHGKRGRTFFLKGEQP